MARIIENDGSVAGLTRLSVIDNEEVGIFIRQAFNLPSLSPTEKKEFAGTKEYAVIWGSLRATLADVGNEVLEILSREEDETVIVGFNDGIKARELTQVLSKKEMNVRRFKDSRLAVSVRVIAEKNKKSAEKAGALVAVRLVGKD